MSENSSLLFYNNLITTSANYSYGIFLQGENYNNISSNNITTSGNASYGIYFNESTSSTLTNNIIKTGESDSYVLYLLSVSNHSFYNNIFNTSTSGSGVYWEDGDVNYFNTTNTSSTNILGKTNIGGNFWTNSQGTGYSDTCTNLDSDYFCDSVYRVINFSNDNIDYLPLANHLSIAFACTTFNIANRYYVLNQSISATGTCFNIDANNITLNFTSYNITGNGAGNGIDINSYNDTTILGGLIYNFSKGIYLVSNSGNNLTNIIAENNSHEGIHFKSSESNSLVNVTSNNNNYGFSLEASSNNNLTTLIANNNTYSGIYFNSTSDNNTITDVFIANSSTDYGIRFKGGANNVIANVIIDSPAKDGVYLTDSDDNSNNFTNVNVTGISGAYYDIKFGEDINGTWIENIKFTNYSFTGAGGKVNFKEPGYGEIVFLEAINGSGNILKDDVDIENNSVFVNSAINSGLNKSANISFYSVSFTDPKPKYSFDNIIWTDCTTTTKPACAEFSFTTGGTFKFNVSHFTYFKIIEGYSAPAGSSSSSSSGGGTSTASFWTYGYSISDFQLSEGYTKQISAKSRILFNVDLIQHEFGIISLTSTTALINVSSTPQQATLAIGDTRRFEVTGDNYYDLQVILNSIGNSLAEMTIKSINEEITNQTFVEEEKKEAEAKGEEEINPLVAPPGIDKKTYGWLWITITIGVFLIIAIIVFVIYKKADN